MLQTFRYICYIKVGWSSCRGIISNAKMVSHLKCSRPVEHCRWKACRSSVAWTFWSPSLRFPLLKHCVQVTLKDGYVQKIPTTNFIISGYHIGWRRQSCFHMCRQAFLSTRFSLGCRLLRVWRLCWWWGFPPFLPDDQPTIYNIYLPHFSYGALHGIYFNVFLSKQGIPHTHAMKWWNKDAVNNCMHKCFLQERGFYSIYV